MYRKIDIDSYIGKQFGQWTVIADGGKSKSGKSLVKCQCTCGKVYNIAIGNLENGLSTKCKSCATKKHGMSRTRIYSEYKSMLGRCYCKSHTSYPKYGAKGVIVCDEWLNNFMAFHDWAMSHGYTDELTLDRLDSTKGYSPDNCRWATYAEQNSHLAMLKTNKSGYKGVCWNKRSNRWLVVISINNKSKRIGEYNTQKEAIRARNAYIGKHRLKNHEKIVYDGEKIIKRAEQIDTERENHSHNIENGQYMKGHNTWNKGKYGYMGANRTSFTKEDIAKKRQIGKIQKNKDGLVCVSEEVRPVKSRNGKIYMHQKRISYGKWLMEKELGRKLESNEVVYHIDGDAFNNDISNLEVITRAELVKRNKNKN